MKRISKSMLATFMVLAIVLSGCSGKSKNMVSVDDLTEQIKGKYAQEEKYDYVEPMYDLKRNHEFELDIDKEKLNEIEGLESWSQLVEVYSDSELTKKVSSQYLLSDDEKKLTMTPFRNGKYTVPDPDFGGRINEQEEFQDWGNSQQNYLVKYYDLKTGEKLAKPEVMVFTVETELKQTPTVKFSINENGIAQLDWNEVEGAEEYIVFSFEEAKEKPSADPYISIIAKTKETKWVDEDTRNVSKNNWNFRTAFGKSEDQAYGDAKKKLDKGEIDSEEFLKTLDFEAESEYDLSQNKYIGVIAVSKDGTSKVSNFIDKRVAASQTPISAAYYLNEGGLKLTSDKVQGTVDTDINLLSSHIWIIMGDGKAVQKLIDYNTENVKETRKTITYFKADDDGNAILDDDGNPIVDEVKSVPVLSVPVSVSGTAITGYAEIENYDKDKYSEQLKALKERQDALKDKTGGVEKETNLDGEVEEDGKEASSEVRKDHDNVFASSALSEYLALQMLSGETTINLDAFKEASDKDYLLDAWYEAVYQNPLILGVKSLSYDAVNNNVMITYDQDAKKQQKKQDEIVEKVDGIVSEIIKEGMSDYEKEVAINDYLCKTAEYDMSALENAEQNDFASVDAEFDDSFTAYGILINGKGVCAGYAGAFKLIADKAGLESIVVTGNLDGSLPHAWNRVKIGEEWLSLDATNNDNEFIVNSLLNIPDSLSKKVLVEDDLYVMNTELEKYKGPSDEYEYYKVNDKFFSQDEIVNKLVEGLKDGDSVTLRTNYNISDDEFYKIAQSVADETKIETLKGTYYLGVIYLTK